MSRSERRAYQRMTKHQDPYAPPSNPAARARLERRARREASAPASDPARLLSARGAWMVFGGALGVFLIGLSVAWHPGNEMNALLIGIAAGVAWLAATLAFAVWRRRGRMAGVGQRNGPVAR